MPGFPSWFIATLVAAGGVWMVIQWNPQAAWYLVILIVLGVLIMRDSSLTQLNDLLGTIFSSTSTGANTTAPVQSPMD